MAELTAFDWVGYREACISSAYFLDTRAASPSNIEIPEGYIPSSTYFYNEGIIFTSIYPLTKHDYLNSFEKFESKCLSEQAECRDTIDFLKTKNEREEKAYQKYQLQKQAKCLTTSVLQRYLQTTDIRITNFARASLAKVKELIFAQFPDLTTEAILEEELKFRLKKRQAQHRYRNRKFEYLMQEKLEDLKQSEILLQQEKASNPFILKIKISNKQRLKINKMLTNYKSKKTNLTK